MGKYPLSQCFVYPVGGVAAHAGHPVRVAVEGQLHAGVSERLLHVGRVRPPREQEGSVSVPEIMPSYVGQPCPLEERFEVAVDYVLGVERGALARGENEPRVLVVKPPLASPRPASYGGF